MGKTYKFSNLVKVEGAYWCRFHGTIHLGDKDSFSDAHHVHLMPLYRKAVA